MPALATHRVGNWMGQGAASLAVISVLATGCGNGGAASTQARQPATSDPSVATAPGVQIDKTTQSGNGAITWGTPDRGVEVRSVSDVAADLPFSPTVSPALGAPARIFTSPSEAPRPYRWLAFVYNHEKYGIFQVRQSALEIPVSRAQAVIERMGGACPVGEECAEGRSLVKLGNGATALLLGGEPGGAGTTSVQFIDPKRLMLIVVMGPGDTFGGSAAVEIANELAAASG